MKQRPVRGMRHLTIDAIMAAVRAEALVEVRAAIIAANPSAITCAPCSNAGHIATRRAVAAVDALVSK